MELLDSKRQTETTLARVVVGVLVFSFIVQSCSWKQRQNFGGCHQMAAQNVRTCLHQLLYWFVTAAYWPGMHMTPAHAHRTLTRRRVLLLVFKGRSSCLDTSGTKKNILYFSPEASLFTLLFCNSFCREGFATAPICHVAVLRLRLIACLFRRDMSSLAKQSVRCVLDISQPDCVASSEQQPRAAELQRAEGLKDRRGTRFLLFFTHPAQFSNQPTNQFISVIKAQISLADERTSAGLN